MAFLASPSLGIPPVVAKVDKQKRHPQYGAMLAQILAIATETEAAKKAYPPPPPPPPMQAPPPPPAAPDAAGAVGQQS